MTLKLIQYETLLLTMYKVVVVTETVTFDINLQIHCSLIKWGICSTRLTLVWIFGQRFFVSVQSQRQLFHKSNLLYCVACLQLDMLFVHF